MRIMDFLKQKLLYRNIPNIQTGDRVHRVKGEVAKEYFKTHQKFSKINQILNKTTNYHLNKT